jgi:DNA-binding NarL/FixJ family response regulator
VRPLFLETLEDSMPPITVLIAVEPPLLRAGLRLVLALQEDLQVVGEAADGPQMLRLVEALYPDILLLDLQLPEVGGLAILPQLQARSPRTSVLLLSAMLNDAVIAEALQQGSKGYVPKTATPDVLIKAIRKTYSGELWVRRALLTQVVEHLCHQVQEQHGPRLVRREILTAREHEIVRGVQQGLTNKEIAAQLGISPKTVKTHLSAIFRKVQVRRRVQLLRTSLA